MVSLKRISIQYFTSIVLAVSVLGLANLIVAMLPDIGYGFLTVFYVAILLGLIVFYFATTFLNGWQTVFSFVVNFIAWVAEQVNLENALHDRFIYRFKDDGFSVFNLGGLLWTTNKILIDFIFIRQGNKVSRSRSRVENLIKNVLRL